MIVPPIGTSPSRQVGPDYPRYVISIAAELAGIHPQTLRAYERVGLVQPARTASGGRRYSDLDLVRVARIAELTRLGLPHVGIKLVLDLEEQLRRLQARAAGPEPSEARAAASGLANGAGSRAPTRPSTRSPRATRRNQP